MNFNPLLSPIDAFTEQPKDAITKTDIYKIINSCPSVYLEEKFTTKS